MIGSICAPMPSCVLSFDILRNKMFAFMSDDSVDQSDQVEFRKKIQFHIGYDAHCKLLLDSLKKKGSVLANASVEPRGQLKETDGGMDDGLFDTEESEDNGTKNLRLQGRSKKSRSSAQASESLPVEPMTTLTLQGIILSLEGDVSVLQGAVTALQDTVTTLHGLVLTLEGIMVRFPSVRENITLREIHHCFLLLLSLQSFHFPGGILASGSTVDNRKLAPVSSVRSVVAKRQLSVHKDSSDSISTSKSKSRRITKAVVSKALTKKVSVACFSAVCLFLLMSGFFAVRCLHLFPLNNQFFDITRLTLKPRRDQKLPERIRRHPGIRWERGRNRNTKRRRIMSHFIR